MFLYRRLGVLASFEILDDIAQWRAFLSGCLFSKLTKGIAIICLTAQSARNGLDPASLLKVGLDLFIQFRAQLRFCKYGFHAWHYAINTPFIRQMPVTGPGCSSLCPEALTGLLSPVDSDSATGRISGVESEGSINSSVDQAV